MGAGATLADPTSREAFTIGGSWAVLTILFEFGFGRYVAGDSWSTLRHAYNLAEGQLWAAVPTGPRSGRRSSGGLMAAADHSDRDLMPTDEANLKETRSMTASN